MVWQYFQVYALRQWCFDMIRHIDKRRSRGTAIVEAAVVLPLLLLLTLGAMEYGWLFLKAQQVTNAARHGARVRIRPAADDQEAYDAIDALMTAVGIPSSVYTTTITTAAPVDERPTVTVRIVANTSGLLLIDAPELLPTPSTIKAEITMALEGL